MARAFVATPKAVTEFLARLRLQKADVWEPIYLDPTTGLQWVGYRLDDNPGDQPPTMLRLKDMSLGIACGRAARTDFDDEAAAAGHYIRWFIPSDAAFTDLISALEEAVSSQPTKQTFQNVLTALAWAELTEPFNFRPVMGKSVDAVAEDFEYYKVLSRRAQSLIEQARSRTGTAAKKNPAVFRDC